VNWSTELPLAQGITFGATATDDAETGR